MVVVKGLKWIWKKNNDGTYRVRCLTNYTHVTSFDYYPTTQFKIKNLKKAIRRQIERCDSELKKE